MRILALDFGTRRLGVAISDELHTIAQPLEQLDAEPFANVVSRLKTIVREREVGQIVVGLPRNMDGSYGPAALQAQAFAAALKEALALPVTTWDERLTSAQATRFLIEGNVSREARKTKVDKTAAALLLQTFLDARQNRQSPTE